MHFKNCVCGYMALYRVLNGFEWFFGLGVRMMSMVVTVLVIFLGHLSICIENVGKSTLRGGSKCENDCNNQ